MAFIDKLVATSTANKADKLIRDYAFSSGLVGLVPLPLLDTLSLIGVQRFMLFRLSRLYGVPFKKNLSKIALTTSTSGITATTTSPLLSSLFKLVPGVGSLAGGASMAAMGSASTYAVGKVFQQHFEKGGTLEDFDPEQAKEVFEAELAKGQELAKNKLSS